MPTLNNQAVSISWEDLFDQATEDISIYLWAAQSWLAPPSDYTQGYVLTLALCHRARSWAAQGWIKGDVPQEMEGYARSLANMLERADNAMIRSLAESGGEMADILNTQVLSMAQTLEHALDRVLGLEEDTRLYENQPELALESREAAHEFVVRFAMLDLLRKELETSLFENVQSADLIAILTRVEKRFQDSFSAFYVLRDLWSAFSAREYGKDYWWLDKSPIALEEMAEAPLEESLLAVFGQALAEENKALDEQRIQQAISLGLEELDPAEERSLQQSLVLDSAAMGLSHDVRQAAREAMSEEKVPDVLPALAKALRSPSSAKLRLQAIKASLSWLFSPKFAAAAAMACLALFIFITFPTGPDIRQVSPPDSELASVSPQVAGPQGLLTLIARKNDSRLNRVSPLSSSPESYTMEPGWSLESGDALKVNATVDQDAYVHVIHLGPGKVASGLFSGFLKAGETLELPNKDWFVLDRKVGEESIILVSGHEPVADLDNTVAGITSLEDAEKAFTDRHVQVFTFKHL